jgi:hypothetical protein
MPVFGTLIIVMRRVGRLGVEEVVEEVEEEVGDIHFLLAQQEKY